MCEERVLGANNLGAFYRFVNSKMGRMNGIAPLLDPMGNLLLSDQEKADLLNNYFCSVFTEDNGRLPNFKSRIPADDPGICDIEINQPVIHRIILKLKPSTGPGPDGLPAVFFKHTISSITFPLSVLFRSFMDLHDLPSEWKEAVITPIFKKANPSECCNYRPIAITCICCKLFESIVVSNLLDYLNDRNLINNCQHGFFLKHSCLTNLLESCRDWSVSLSNHKSILVANIDFQRAFDSVSHNKLLHKLSAYGIHGNLYLCLASFLSNRFQRVKVGSAVSSNRPVGSGVPQGSVVAAILFNLFINDLTDTLDSNIVSKLFADDVTLYTTVTNPVSHAHFQSALNTIMSWSNEWQLPISNAKSNIFVIGKPVDATFTLDGTSPLGTVSSVLSLGITLEHDLDFSSHIHNIVTKAKRTASLIFRCFYSKHVHQLLRAYVVYVRPLVEYATQIWSPHTLQLITLVEDVQRSFTRRLPGFADLSYEERLVNLNLQSLEHRRLIADLSLCYKIIHGLICLTFKSFLRFRAMQPTEVTFIS